MRHKASGQRLERRETTEKRQERQRHDGRGKREARRDEETEERGGMQSKTDTG